MKRLYLLAVVAVVIALSKAEECPSNIGDSQIEYISHESDCHKYYKCTKLGGKVPQDCPFDGANQWCFDKTLKACKFPTEDCCKDTPGNNDECPCSNDAKCKMYFSNDIVEVCVKKTPGVTLHKSS